MILTWSFSQDDILRAILDLHNSGRPFDADITYGNGAFYRGEIPAPRNAYDITPLKPGVIQASYDNLPVADGAFDSVVFDPPFLTYVQGGRSHNSIMARRFSGFHRYSELLESYRGAITECSRVLRPQGILVVKCQDIVHNHALHITHLHVVDMAERVGFKVLDNFILLSKRRMGKRGKQRHARIGHCHFLVFRRKGRKIPEFHGLDWV